jgi:hypothetical protein
MVHIRQSFVGRMLVLLGVACSFPAAASTHTGTVAMLELWPNGNVVFTLDGTTLPCLGQAVVNQSSGGVKNIYAALLSAKLSNRTVQLNTGGCVAADGYNPSVLYARVDYLYVN